MAIMKKYVQGELPENMYGNEAAKQGDSKTNVVKVVLLYLPTMLKAELTKTSLKKVNHMSMVKSLQWQTKEITKR